MSLTPTVACSWNSLLSAMYLLSLHDIQTFVLVTPGVVSFQNASQYNCPFPVWYHLFSDTFLGFEEKQLCMLMIAAEGGSNVTKGVLCLWAT